jgi:LacI family transcriptional regulator
MIGSGNEMVICAAPPPSLTSINLGYPNIGYRAAELLDRLMDGQAPPDGPVLLAPAELVPRQSTDSYAVDDPLVARALRFIAEHAHEPIKVDDVAAATPTTRRSLERRFQNAMRRTIGDEIIRMRLERAKRRLVEADEPLKKVAKDSGFSSDNHFYRAFIRSEGVSPSQYRKQRRAEN